MINASKAWNIVENKIAYDTTQAVNKFLNNELDLDHVNELILKKAQEGRTYLITYSERMEHQAIDVDLLKNSMQSSDKVQSLRKAGYNVTVNYADNNIQLYISWNKSKAEKELPF